MQCYQGQKPVRETVIDVFFLPSFFILKFNAGKTQYFNFLLILPTSHNIHVVLFLVKMMAIVFYCTPTLDVFWILGLLTLRLKKVKIVKSMIIKKPSKVIQSIYFLEVFWMSQPPKLLFQYTAIVIFLNFHFFIIFSTHWELPAAVNASSFLPIFSLSYSLTYRK